MMPRDTNAHGTIFGGVILSHIDLAAAVEARHHHAGRFVTVAMDKIVFKAPVHVGDVVSFYTELHRIGTTSMTIKVSVWAEQQAGRQHARYVTEADVTFVAVDEELRKTPISGRRTD